MDPSDPQNTLDTLQRKLDTLERAKSRLDLLFTSKPTNADYRIQRARILDKEALIELELNRNSPKAYEWSSEAIDDLDKAIQSVPENGGLHEQRAILLEHLVTIMKEHGKAPKDIRKKESEEVTEYTRALELRPGEDSPLWGAVYAQIDLGNSEAAVDLARTITRAATRLHGCQCRPTSLPWNERSSLRAKSRKEKRKWEIGWGHFLNRTRRNPNYWQFWMPY